MHRSIAIYGVIGLLLLGNPSWGAKDTLVVVNNIDPGALDPIYVRDIAGSTICSHLFNSLVVLDRENRILPSLAERWEAVSPTAWRFYLRGDVVFHNGEKFTALDVKYTMDRVLSPEGAGVRLYTENIKSVEVEDERTVVFHLNWPDKGFLARLSNTPFYVVNRKAVETMGDKSVVNPIGTGPFILERWEKGSQAVLIRNENYWGKKPAFRTLIHCVVPEVSSRMIELETEAADISLFIGRNDIKRILDNPNLKLERHLMVASTFIGMNCKKPPFDNPKIREAFWCALDIPAMYNAVVRGVGQLSSGIIPSTVMYSVPFRKEHKRDVERAKKLLLEAGVKGRLTVEIWMNENKDRVDLMTIAQSMLAEVGIDASLKVIEMGTYLSAMRRGEHQVFVHGRSFPLPDPDLYLGSSFSTKAIGSLNYCLWSDPTTDKLLDEARVEQDDEKRAQLYTQLQNYLEEQVAWIPLYTLEQVAGVRKHVHNFVLDAKGFNYFGDVTFVEEE